MYYSLPYKTKQFFWLVIKLVIVIGCGYLICKKLLENDQLEFSVFRQHLIKNDLFSTKNILFLFVFTFFNHFFEILKWEALTSFCIKISKKSAAIQSLVSLSASLITPNRIGEYGVKAMYFDNSLRKKIIGLNMIGNFYQMLMTIIFGVIGFGYFIIINNISINYYTLLKISLLAILIGSTIFFAIKYMKIKGYSAEKVITFIKKVPFVLNLKVAVLSFLRFIVFAHQFYFLLLIFKIDISYLNAISAISSMYMIASIVPMLSVFDFVLKGTVAIWVFSFLGVEPISILTITTLMWLLNFALPALIGSYFVLTFTPNLAK
tara:strand:- start:1501 stop:2460 length:960 start_codon:yes stop_codon:yes gene_type:complete